MNVCVFIRHGHRRWMFTCFMKAKHLRPVDDVSGPHPGRCPRRQNGESSLPPTPRPAERPEGENKGQSGLGTGCAMWGRGANTGNGTISRPHLPGTRVDTRPSVASPTPGRMAQHSDADRPAPAWRMEQREGGEGHLGARAAEQGVTWDPQSQLGTLGGLDATAWRQGGWFSFLGSPLSLLFPVRLPDGTPCCPRSQDPALEEDVLQASVPG